MTSRSMRKELLKQRYKQQQKKPETLLLQSGSFALMDGEDDW